MDIKRGDAAMNRPCNKNNFTGVFVFVILALMAGGAWINCYVPSLFDPLRLRFFGPRTVEQVMATLEPKLGRQTADLFTKAGCGFPDTRLTFIAMKQERRLEVWCASGGSWKMANQYSILAASGLAGPKLKEGDLQVPEGIYSIPVFNPNSRFHLSMKLNYPNEFDQRMARADGRTRLGGDIFIHGSFFSIGCLAMGDSAIEELFYMARKVGSAHTRVIVMPYDFRKTAPSPPAGAPSWTAELYRRIQENLAPFKSA